MNPVQIFNKVHEIVKTKENYVPRNYETVGGFWTVDTWVKDGVRAQLLDEGETSRLVTDDLIVSKNYDYQKRESYLTFTKGDEQVLKTLYDKFV